jgi:hypothetical protein
VDAGDRTFVAHLSARDEVPSNESLAQGQAIFDLSADGTQLDYKLIAANIYTWFGAASGNCRGV